MSPEYFIIKLFTAVINSFTGLYPKGRPKLDPQILGQGGSD